MITHGRLVLLFPLFVVSAKALDVVLKSVDCNRTLPLYLKDDDLQILCEGESRCSLGSDATLKGKCKEDDATSWSPSMPVLPKQCYLITFLLLFLFPLLNQSAILWRGRNWIGR